MNVRRIAAAAGFATGAALAFAPLAAADPSDFAASTLDSEISSQNSLFELEALLGGQYNDVTLATAPGAFDTIPATDIPTTAAGGAPTTLEYELYGVNPIAAGISGDTGPYSEFNGALTQFDNALNVEYYSALNGGSLDTNLDDYIYNGTIQNVLATPGETTTQAFDTLYNHAIGDLSGYFQTDLSSLEVGVTPAAAADSVTGVTAAVGSEISSANSLFESYAALAGLPAADIVTSTGGFDTLAPNLADSAQLAAFDTSVFGFDPANVTPDVGAYDLFNGAISKFDDAINFGVYALENGGNALPLADFASDLFGNTSSLTTELTGLTASQAITDLLGNSFSDLLGYFDFGSIASL